MKPFPKLPNPHTDHAGRNFVERKSKEAFSRIAKLWQPSGEENETTHSTVSRYTQYLIDLLTGKAYSADQVMTADENGVFRIGPINTVAANQPTGGELRIPAWQRIVFEGLDGSGKCTIYNFAGHSGGDELIFECPRFCVYWDTVMQFGNANGGPHGILLHSGSASAGDTMRPSVPIFNNTVVWDGAQSVLNRVASQARPIDSSGAAEWIMNENVTNLGTSQDIDGDNMIRVCSQGVYSAGTAPAFATLPDDGSTVTQTCSIYRNVQAGKVTLQGPMTLDIDGAQSGMRGVIYVYQDAIGSRTLALPSGSATASGWALSTTALAVDRLMWEFDGTYFYWTIDKGITLPVDADAASFISVTGATDTSAINAWVTGLKALGLWDTSVCWPMRSNQNYGTGTSLKSLGGLGAYNGTLDGPTWGADGIIFDGTNDKITIANPAKSTAVPSLSVFSVFDSDQSVQRAVFGGFNGTTTIAPQIWAGGSPTGGSVGTSLFYSWSFDGGTTNGNSIQVGSANTGVMQTAGISLDSTESRVFYNTSSSAQTPVRATYWNDPVNWYMGMRASGSYFFLGTQAFNLFSTTRLTAAQHTALRDLYKATLGAGLSLP